MKIWVDSGIGDELPKEISVAPNETVGTFRRKYATKLDVPVQNIDLTTDVGPLKKDNAKLDTVLDDQETIHVTPRAKAGC